MKQLQIIIVLLIAFLFVNKKIFCQQAYGVRQKGITIPVWPVFDLMVVTLSLVNRPPV